MLRRGVDEGTEDSIEDERGQHTPRRLGMAQAGKKWIQKDRPRAGRRSAVGVGVGVGVGVDAWLMYLVSVLGVPWE